MIEQRTCVFYETAVLTIKGEELQIHREHNGEREMLAWCRHPKHSPMTEEMAENATGDEAGLTCNGNLRRCPITDKFHDL